MLKRFKKSIPVKTVLTLLPVLKLSTVITILKMLPVLAVLPVFVGFRIEDVSKENASTHGRVGNAGVEISSTSAYIVGIAVEH